MPPRPTSRTISKSPSRCSVGGWSSGDGIRLPHAGVTASCLRANSYLACAVWRKLSRKRTSHAAGGCARTVAGGCNYRKHLQWTRSDRHLRSAQLNVRTQTLHRGGQRTLSPHEPTRYRKRPEPRRRWGRLAPQRLPADVVVASFLEAESSYGAACACAKVPEEGGYMLAS